MDGTRSAWRAAVERATEIPQGSPSLAPPPPASTHYAPKTRRAALVALVVLATLAAAWVAHALWVALLLGVVMAVSVRRPYRALVRRMGDGRRAWAAGIVTLLSGAIVATIGSIALVALSSELMKLVQHLDAHGSSGSLEGLLGGRGAAAVARLGVDTSRLYGWLESQLAAASTYVTALAAIVVKTTSHAVLALVMSLMTMYYFLVEGDELTARIERIAPLEPRHTRALIQEAGEVGRDAFLGTLATAVIQGALAGIGYAVLGVPQPITWAVATAMASFVPVIGTIIVWGPVSGWLVVEGHPVRALLLFAWGIFVVTSLADYVIRPRIIGARRHSHPLLTLIALLGGLEVFGLVGLVVAPIVMSVLVATFRIYERELRASEISSPPEGGPPPGSARTPAASSPSSGGTRDGTRSARRSRARRRSRRRTGASS